MEDPEFAGYSWFMPPTEQVWAKKPRTDAAGIRGVYRRGFEWWLTGEPLSLGGWTFAGGRWNGPLTAAQVSALTSGGFAARIATALSEAGLPPGL